MVIASSVDIEEVGRIGFEIQTKKCKTKKEGGCGEELPITEFSIKKSRGVPRISHFCKKCYRRRRKVQDKARMAIEGEVPAGNGQERFKGRPKNHTGPKKSTPLWVFFCKVPMSELAYQERTRKMMKRFL